MEPASKILRKLPLLADVVGAEELARAAWPLAVGKKIAAHAHVIKMVRSNLIVEVEDDLWQRQLFGLRHQVLGKLAERLGRGAVEEIEFRVAPRRRGPERARQITARTERDDEAAGIVDPVLRNIYKAARKRALG